MVKITLSDEIELSSEELMGKEDFLETEQISIEIGIACLRDLINELDVVVVWGNKLMIIIKAFTLRQTAINYNLLSRHRKNSLIT